MIPDREEVNRVTLERIKFRFGLDHFPTVLEPTFRKECLLIAKEVHDELLERDRKNTTKEEKKEGQSRLGGFS